MSYSSNNWEKYYQKTPINKIPWNRTQADYFTKIIEENKIKPGLTLDIGCGVGAKSIYLAKREFKVTGIDISKTAIELAKENAKKAKVKINFASADATDLSFLKNKKFDFILDWANLHGIPKNKRKKYITGIAKHLKKDGKLLLRCFGRNKTQEESVTRPVGRIYRFSEEEIKKIFSKYFDILEINKSKPFSANPPSKWLNEYLMKRL